MADLRVRCGGGVAELRVRCVGGLADLRVAEWVAAWRICVCGA